MEKTEENNYYVSHNANAYKEKEEQLKEAGEIVVSFTEQEWENASKVILGEMKEFQEDAARKYVATKIFKELEMKYPRLKEEYHGSNYLPIFKSGSEAAYQKKCDLIYNIFDVGDILAVEEIQVKKVHIFVEGIDHPILGKALMELLRDDNAFAVDLYSTYTPTEKVEVSKKETSVIK